MTMPNFEIDLNCDVGEGVGNEQELFPHISSCNIAGGGHAGNRESMKEIVTLAGKAGVRAGAHPSYPDRENFGRKHMQLTARELEESLLEQLQLLDEVAAAAGVPLHHIKAHGALYNDLAENPALAREYLRILTPYRESRVLFVPAGSDLMRRASSLGYRVWGEAFADRAYNADGSLVARSEPGAVLTEAPRVFRQVRDLVLRGRATTPEGREIKLSPDTICIHGDTPGALEILMYLSLELPKESIRLLS